MANRKALKLAILDDYASLAPEYFQSFKGTQLLTDISSYPETLDTHTDDGLAAAVDRLKPYHIISSMRERTKFPRQLLSQLPNLRLLMNTGPWNRSIDLNAAKEYDIIVTGTYSRYVDKDLALDFDNTTQHAWSLILALTSRIPEDNYMLSNNKNTWQTGFMTSLAGKTLGIVGLGRLGGRTARTAVLGFGMKVIAWSQNLTQEKADQIAFGFGLEKAVFRVVSKQELFGQSDVVSLHLVMSDRSRDTVTENELALMKKTASLVNTARADLVNEEALWNTLVAGKIAGFASDVWWNEPLSSESKWRRSDFFGINGRSRLIMSPHMGYVEIDVMRSWFREQSEILDAWFGGQDLTDWLLKGG